MYTEAGYAGHVVGYFLDEGIPDHLSEAKQPVSFDDLISLFFDVAAAEQLLGPDDFGIFMRCMVLLLLRGEGHPSGDILTDAGVRILQPSGILPVFYEDEYRSIITHVSRHRP